MSTAAATASNQKLDYALKFYDLGFWVIPLYAAGEVHASTGKLSDGKQPFGTGWGAERRSAPEIRKRFRNRPDSNFGFCEGPGRAPGGGWLIDLEGDGPRAEDSYLRLTGGELVDTFSWTSTRAPHRLHTADGALLLDLLALAGAVEGSGIKAGVWKLAEFPDLEFRVGGFHEDGREKQFQSVAPPCRTLAKDGTLGPAREWNGVEVVAELPEAAYAALEAIAERKAIQELVDEPEQPRPAQGRNGQANGRSNGNGKGGPKVSEMYPEAGELSVEERARRYIRKGDPAISGEGGSRPTFRLACKIGPGFDLPLETALRVLMEEYNPKCVPPWSEKELRHKLDDAYRKEPRRGWMNAEWEARRKEKAEKPAGGGKGRREDHEPAAVADDELVVRADSVEKKKVKWLWPNRVPFGFIAIFAGRTGVGKSFVACDIAARHTRGDDFPDGEPGPGEPGNVLVISEDPHDFVLRPRVEALGADLSRVCFMTWKAMTAYTLADTDMLTRTWKASGEPSLIVIDPPNNFLGGIDEHRNGDVRGVLMLLVKWLIEREKPVALVLITQVTKGGKEVEAVNRIIGSVAWTATPRIAHTFAQDPDNPGTALFSCPKNNLGPLPRTLKFAISPTDEFARLDWLGESEKTADEAMGHGKAEKCSEAAKRFLAEQFEKNEVWDSETLHAEGQKKGISRNALFEAKKELGIRAQKRGISWVWMMPPPEYRDG